LQPSLPRVSHHLTAQSSASPHLKQQAHNAAMHLNTAASNAEKALRFYSSYLHLFCFVFVAAAVLRHITQCCLMGYHDYCIFGFRLNYKLDKI
jgi:hypothetical protein